MDLSRREWLAAAGKFIIFSAAALEAFESPIGALAADSKYKMADHWWAMIIDIEQVHRLRQLRARLRGGERRARRILPHLGGALRSSWRGHGASRTSIRPTAACTASRYTNTCRRKSFFVPKLCNHCADSPCIQVCPVGATFVSPDGVVLVDEKYCLGCRYCVQACPYGCRYLHPDQTRAREVHALLSPHHQRADDGLLRSLPDRRAPDWRT